jgi:hypothetical protein
MDHFPEHKGFGDLLREGVSAPVLVRGRPARRAAVAGGTPALPKRRLSSCAISNKAVGGGGGATPRLAFIFCKA